MPVQPRRLAIAFALVLAAVTTGTGVASAESGTRGWAATWTASPQRPGVNYTPNWSEEGFSQQTVRQVVRISVGGVAARVRLSNVYGTTPLKVAGATVARTADGAAVRRGSVRHLTVNGARAFSVSAGAEIASDPVPLPVEALSSVTVTLYLAAPTGPATYHAQAMAPSYRASGDHRADVGGAAFTETTVSWYYLSGVDVIGGTHRRGVVAFGDSLTDGYGSKPGADNRYPDELAERLAAAGRPRAVLNQGIGGNRVTVDSMQLGDKGTSRFRRDVLSQPGVGTVIVLEGINDIGMSRAPSPIGAPPTDVSARQVIAGHRELIRQARAKGVRVIGATLPPMKGSQYYDAVSEAKRDEVNAWIRTSGEYDAVLDLDRVLASSSDGDQLDPAYDSGDHLHLNDTGYRAVANAVDPADLR
ncbi:SGNH/GDSL hydrolase family protein [Nonomuraea sp. NPDC050547]|uniref:SGNH/GDSL hydrolase family protein n=1 Tax=Nonomuraea sp. NPDC050547 TaxID=3364368 RepID=UPI00378F79FD